MCRREAGPGQGSKRHSISAVGRASEAKKGGGGGGEELAEEGPRAPQGRDRQVDERSRPVRERGWMLL